MVYGLASAFVHPSTTEQWGLVVNEAAAAGLPLIVSERCGCAPELVRQGVTGFLFDPYDIDAICSRYYCRVTGYRSKGPGTLRPAHCSGVVS